MPLASTNELICAADALGVASVEGVSSDDQVHAMVIDIPMIVDWILEGQKREQQIDERLIAANHNRILHGFFSVDHVLRHGDYPSKFDPRVNGPYKIQLVYNYGTLTPDLEGRVIERINIRRVRPYFSELRRRIFPW